jgi:hypothetical protein
MRVFVRSYPKLPAIFMVGVIERDGISLTTLYLYGKIFACSPPIVCKELRHDAQPGSRLHRMERSCTIRYLVSGEGIDNSFFLE